MGCFVKKERKNINHTKTQQVTVARLFLLNQPKTVIYGLLRVAIDEVIKNRILHKSSKNRQLAFIARDINEVTKR